MSPDKAAVLGGVLGASFMMIALCGAVLAVLMIIARWKIFTKAGVEGWKSIIPIYSDYVEWKIAWNNIAMFWASIGLACGGLILGIATGTFAVTPKGSITMGNGGFLAIVCIALILAGLVISFIQKFKLFKSFGKGAGWFIAYLFFTSIVTLILGFGSAEYEGPQD